MPQDALNKPWLKNLPSLKAQLDELSLPAQGLWSAFQFWSANNDATGIIPKHKLVSVAARRMTEAKLLPLVAELVAEGLLLDHGDTWELTPWENPDLATWNDPVRRERWRRDKALKRDEKLCKAIQARDMNLCRYCGQRVSWTNKHPDSPYRATYDHIDPDGDNSLANVVVACADCNCKKKKDQPLEIAKMVLWVAGTTAADVASGAAVPLLDYRRSTARSTPGQPGGQPAVNTPLASARDSGPGRPEADRGSTGSRHLSAVRGFDPDEDESIESERVQAMDALIREAQ